MSDFDFENEYKICANLNINWERLDNKTIMITGATGLVGRYMIEALLVRNQIKGIHTKIVAVGRSEENFLKRFKDLADNRDLYFYKHDVQNPCLYEGRVDFIVHMASNTHPRLYATDPIGTEMINILGSYYLLEFAVRNPGCRFVFTSSGDIYGDNRSDNPYLTENDCGYINCNTLRAGYIEGKRASEALCNAYKESKDVDFVIPRLCRVYGTTMNISESKAISQFIVKAINKEDIVLKSKGTQVFSYLYVFDVVTAILTIMTKGKSGEAYNVADNNQVKSLRDLAAELASIGDSRVSYDIPDSLEAKGASNFQDVRLDGTKLKGLGWESKVDLIDGLKWTVGTLRKEYYETL